MGPGGRAMLICQPPIKEMTVQPSCCRSYRVSDYGGHNEPILPPPPPYVVVKSDTGLTVGDMLNAAAAARYQHLQCPYAPEHDHDCETGLVDIKIYFEGYMALLPGDPAMPNYYNPDDYQSSGGYDFYAYERERPNLLRDHSEAKRIAVANQEVVPNFEAFRTEWELANGDGHREGDVGYGDDVDRVGDDLAKDDGEGLTGNDALLQGWRRRGT